MTGEEARMQEGEQEGLAPPSFPLAKEGPLDPPPYARIRGERPVIRVRMWDGSLAWLVTRHADVRAVLQDHARFSSLPHLPGHPHVSAARAALLHNEEVATFQRMDPPRHTEYRRMVARDFLARRIGELRPAIEKKVEDLLDAMIAKGPPADLVRDFAGPLPIAVISEMLGIPFEDHARFQQWTATRMRVHQDPAINIEAARQMRACLDAHIRRLEESGGGGNGILSRLVAEHVVPGTLSRAEAVAVADLLVAAGHETTATMIALGMVVLLQHPDQLARLQAERTLLKGAIEELLRYLTIAHYVAPRVALGDAEIGGVTIRKGEPVLALIAGANRDPEAFTDPDRFDIGREARHHLAFGYGPHLCVGNLLAKAEMEAAFTGLLDRLPGLRLAAPFEEIPFKLDAMVLGVAAVPVTW
jgi:cytochrome P450